MDHPQKQVGVSVVFLGRVAYYARSRGAYVLEARCRREPVAEDEVLGVLCEEPEALLARFECLLCLLALGDITAEAIYGHQFALIIVERGDLLFGPDCPSVFAYP